MTGARRACPDAKLIELVTAHAANLAAFNGHDGRDEAEHERLGQAYDRTRDALDDAKPQTLAGIIALAKAAMAERGRPPPGDEHFEATWAFTALGRLLRICGETEA
jgi:hypothetical protein